MTGNKVMVRKYYGNLSSNDKLFKHEGQFTALKYLDVDTRNNDAYHENYPASRFQLPVKVYTLSEYPFAVTPPAMYTTLFTLITAAPPID